MKWNEVRRLRARFAPARPGGGEVAVRANYVALPSVAGRGAGERRRNSPGWTLSTRQRIPHPEARSLRQKSPEQGLHDVQTVCVWSAARRCARCARLSQGVMQRATTTVLRLAALHVPSLALPSWREILAWLFWSPRDLSEPVSAGYARQASPASRSCSHSRPNSPSSPGAPAP